MSHRKMVSIVDLCTSISNISYHLNQLCVWRKIYCTQHFAYTVRESTVHSPYLCKYLSSGVEGRYILLSYSVWQRNSRACNCQHPIVFHTPFAHQLQAPPVPKPLLTTERKENSLQVPSRLWKPHRSHGGSKQREKADLSNTNPRAN